MNRESWLEAAVVEVSKLFNFDIPEVRVAAGWPSRGGTSLKKRVLGECWKPEVAEDGISQIFLNPMMDNPIDILATLAHELIHAWDKGEHNHKGPFIQAARNVGLTGPWTSTSAGPELCGELAAISERLGKYPHSKLTPSIERKVQTTRMIKVVAECCGYTVRTTQKWIDKGLPSCPCGNEMIVDAPK